MKTRREAIVAVHPSQHNTGWGESVKLIVGFALAPPQPATYRWYVVVDPLAGEHGAGAGTISDGDQFGKDFISTSPVITYSAPEREAVPANRGIDDVYVDVMVGGISIGTAYAQIAFGCEYFDE